MLFSITINIENKDAGSFQPNNAMAKTPDIPGQIVPLGPYSAFVPAPLPPALEWTPRLIGVLSDADRLIGRLAGEGGRLPNPHVLMRPFVRREAVLSSKIEGTQATLGELLAAEAGAAVERSPEDLREVGNYVVALEHGIVLLKELPLSVRLIRELHEKLMEGVRRQHATPGLFRRTQNWIGGPGSTPATATFIPPPPGEVEPCLAAWENFLHESQLPPLVTIALAHYQFEAIHPSPRWQWPRGPSAHNAVSNRTEDSPYSVALPFRVFRSHAARLLRRPAWSKRMELGWNGWSISCWELRACPRMR